MENVLYIYRHVWGVQVPSQEVFGCLGIYRPNGPNDPSSD